MVTNGRLVEVHLARNDWGESTVVHLKRQS